MRIVTIADLERENEILRLERNRFQGVCDRYAKVLAGIHAVIYPQLVTASDGKTYRFIAPDPHIYLQALGDRIRQIPDELLTIPKEL